MNRWFPLTTAGALYLCAFLHGLSVVRGERLSGLLAFVGSLAVMYLIGRYTRSV